MTPPTSFHLYGCHDCSTDALSLPDTLEGDPKCARCGRMMKVVYGTPAVLPPAPDPMDDTLTSFLAGPLPEEALQNSENPANLFGKYVFLHEIGRGATGRVVKAWDTYLSRFVALKFLDSSTPWHEGMDASERVQDFLREARIAARLHHPNIVRIHEVDCRDNRYFISMDFVGGGTLGDLIHGPQDPKAATRFYADSDRLLRLLHSIAIAVHHAHSQVPPVVHRDLKPQNVLIDERGHANVADFGLANEVDVAPGDGRRGEVRGTPGYMAPEQAQGEIGDIDPRTDVYSMGAILYEMLTGESPFRGTNILNILRKIVTESPAPPNEVLAKLRTKPQGLDFSNPEMRAELEGLCLRALSKKREDRPQTMLEFASALEPWIPSQDTTVRTTEARGPFKMRRFRQVGITTVALLAAVLVLSSRLRSTSPASATSVPGDDIATVASGFLSSGKWSSFGEAVLELGRRAPGHPRLKEFEEALHHRGAVVQQHRDEWAALVNGISSGPRPPPPEEFRRRLGEIPELEEEFRASLDRAIARAASAVLDRAREIAGESRDAWLSKETKERAAALRERMEGIDRFAHELDVAVDSTSLEEARSALDPVIAWLGTWNLRINVHPFAEVHLLQGGKEKARDYTPWALSRVEIAVAPVELELFWPSAKEPRRRWKTTLDGLRPGETVIVSGEMDSSDLEVERR